ncbi:MAG: hypothetical protein IJZ51_02445, partial [Ruminiclostridium sp.]|nr:hypothetical protein [Ruminiclostridium sp.]
ERVGGGVPDAPFSYYTNLPVKFQFEIPPICETAVNESSQIAFFKKAEMPAGATRRKTTIYYFSLIRHLR